MLARLYNSIVALVYEEKPANQPPPEPVLVPVNCLKTITKEAVSLYNADFCRITVPLISTSELNVTFDTDSWFNCKPEDANEFEEKLTLLSDDRGANAFVRLRLKNFGSMWGDMGVNCHFNNYFLACLRYENIDGYREIVGRAYGIKFVSGAITLFRRDTRGYKDIFQEGFARKQPIFFNHNSPSVRKKHYANPATYDYGISFSKKIPPQHYGNASCYYVVELSANHKFLLIDIVESPRNKDKLTAYHRSLQEVNSCDDLPANTVKSHVKVDSFWFFGEDKVTTNNRFSENASFDTTVRRYYGCY